MKLTWTRIRCVWFPLFMLAPNELYTIVATKSQWLIDLWWNKPPTQQPNAKNCFCTGCFFFYFFCFSRVDEWSFIKRSVKSFTCVNGSCSELAPHSHTLCSTTLMANFWCATHCGVLQSSISSDDKCEWTRCNNSSKHSAASPKHPNGKRRPASGPLASARRNGSGHNAGSELVCNCWNNS